MRSNITKTKERIESAEQTSHVTLDGDHSEVIVRAIVEDSLDDFESLIDSVPDASIQTVTGTPFGYEVEVW